VSERNGDKARFAENAGPRFCGASAIENCKRRWKQSKTYGTFVGRWEHKRYVSPITVVRSGRV